MALSGTSKSPNVCARCGSILPSGASDCSDCGRPAGAAPEPDGRIYTLLSAANLARMRGQWQEGIDKCVEALRLDPYNPTAHSLVGDIYQDQGRREEAIQWYRLALDLDPNNAADHAKLERAQTPLASEPPPPPPFWIRVGVPSGVILAFLMMSIGVWALITVQEREAPDVVDGTDPPQMRLPRNLRPATGFSFRFHPRPAAPRPPTPAAAPADETPLETRLRGRLQAHLGSTLAATAISLDPGDGSATLSLLLADGASLQPASLAQTLFNLSLWNYREDAALQRCRIRLLRRIRADAPPELAVVADSTRESLFSIPPNTPAATAGSAFRIWWNPQLFPAQPPPSEPPTGAPQEKPPPLPFPSSPARAPS